ncbi:MAG: hypothetical protein H3C43_04640 [Leptonema sp. (in: Bacteria)]|nr:hypothetical protein [Leptonema sp. (in: bacteria)]
MIQLAEKSPNLKLLLSLFITISFGLLNNCQSVQTDTTDTTSDAATERSVQSIDSEKQTQTSSKKPDKIGCIGGNCETGTGTYIYETGDRFVGPFEKGKRQGTGVMEYSNGDRYAGEYDKDIRHGNGTYKFANNDIYEGRFKNGLREGKGNYTFAETGEVFEGEFAKDGATAKGFIKRGVDYYLCEMQNGTLFCSPTPTKDLNKLKQDE